MLPAIHSKLYHQIVNTLIALPWKDPERARLEELQRQLADAQQQMSRARGGVLEEWLKAGKDA